MAIGPEFKAVAVQALLGASRSPLAPEVLWLSWHSTGGLELSAQRVAVPNDDSVWGPTEGGVTNVAPIDGGAAGAWILGGVGLYTAEVGGVLALSAVLGTPITTSAGDLLSILVGELTFTVS